MGKGLFCESENQEDIDNMLAFWNGISEALRIRIKKVMIGNKYCFFGINEQVIKSSVFSADDLTHNGAPLTMVTKMLDLMARSAKEIETIVVPAHEASRETRQLRLVSCEYCGSKYPLDRSAKCPNCGSSYS